MCFLKQFDGVRHCLTTTYTIKLLGISGPRVPPSNVDTGLYEVQSLAATKRLGLMIKKKKMFHTASTNITFFQLCLR